MVEDGGGVEGAEGKLRQLVVDAGALIRLETLHGLAEEFYTVQEVLSEVRDKKARRALETLPFELKVKEPSETALAAVVAFAKETGDLGVLSATDLRVMALTLMLHKEMHGLKGLRKHPKRPRQGNDFEEKKDADVYASDEDFGYSSARAEKMGNLGSEGNEQQGASSAPINSSANAKEGVSWAAAIRKTTVETSAEVKSIAEKTEGNDFDAPYPKDMWDADDFVGPSWDNEEPEDEEWPSLDEVTSENVKEREAFLKDQEELECMIRPVEHEMKSRRDVNQEQTKDESSNVNEKYGQQREQIVEPTAKPQTTSRILGISGISVDSGELDDEGWITPANLRDVGVFDSFNAVGNVSNKDVAPSKAAYDKEKAKVACVTTDFAMQNVMMQMQLRLVTLEGRAVTSIRRFVLKCDSCKAICRKLNKKFCPACGNATLARLSFSICPDGEFRYHYKKNRQVNTRGMRYSLPKPRGGRKGDLLLYEDQLLSGWWAQKVSSKKTTVTSMFGEHISESFGLQLSSPRHDSIRIGYGRDNPNAAKGRERRGKKKKRSTKPPGKL